MTPLKALLLGAAAYGAFLLATLPAAVLAPRVQAASGGQARLEDAAGTAWNGSARLLVAAPAFSVSVDELRWRFLPARLLSGRVAFAVEAKLGNLHAQAEAGRGPLAWHLSGLRADGDAAALAAFFPLAATWQPAGAMAIAAPHLAWDGRRADGELTAEWRDASLALSEARPLGSWRARATADGEAMKISLSTLKGPLRLAGEGRLAPTGRLAFSGEARAEPGHERELEGLLNLLGPRRPDGARALDLR